MKKWKICLWLVLVSVLCTPMFVFAADSGSNTGSGSNTNSSTSTSMNDTKDLHYVACGDVEGIPKPVPQLTSIAYTLLIVGTPLVLIIFSVISLTKAVTAGSQDDVMKAKNKLIKKFVAAAIIYFVAGIGQFVINKAAGASEKSTVLSCMNCFLYNSGCQDSSSTYQQTHGTQTPSSRNPYSSTNSSSNSNSSTAGGVGTGGGVTVANGNRCTDATIYQGTKYSLTDAQKKKLAAMVYAEYSTDLVGKKAVASHMANLYEYKKAHGTTTKSFYDYITTTTWYASGTRVATTVDATALQAVQDCIIDGKRTLPSNIIEFDMFPGDIVNPKGVNDYEQGKTHVDNKYGASGTFWCMSRDENTGDANIFFSVP